MFMGFLLAMVLILTGVVGVLAFSNARLWVELKAMQNSTHNIQWMDPAEIIRKQESGPASGLTREEERELSADPLGSII